MKFQFSFPSFVEYVCTVYIRIYRYIYTYECVKLGKIYLSGAFRSKKEIFQIHNTFIDEISLIRQKVGGKWGKKYKVKRRRPHKKKFK